MGSHDCMITSDAQLHQAQTDIQTLRARLPGLQADPPAACGVKGWWCAAAESHVDRVLHTRNNTGRHGCRLQMAAALTA
jgi:hypothetical protein